MAKVILTKTQYSDLSLVIVEQVVSIRTDRRDDKPIVRAYPGGDVIALLQDTVTADWLIHDLATWIAGDKPGLGNVYCVIDRLEVRGRLDEERKANAH